MAKNDVNIGKVTRLGGNSRIVFYEPNDTFNQIDGAPITPDYSEMNISFSLTVEVVNRLNSAEQKVYNKMYVITWNSNYNEKGELGKSNYVSFMQGDMSTGTPYLTTYYTETTFDDMKKNSRVVEGLGVENVTVAFENYYAPTATIKFVDQRGSALFGREEVNHNNDTLTAETVFGCFFTQPYPKFRLQIKGFFGQPVTYQLVCSGFKGNLNPNTGNFEAVVSFIGYQYGILTDIPFNYLVAAPYCDYAGRAYWGSHVNSEHWTLNDGSGNSVITLYEFFERIENALGKDDLVKSITNAEEDELTANSEKSSQVKNISSYLNSFISDFKTHTGAHGFYSTDNTGDEEFQVLFTYDNEEVDVDAKLNEALSTLNENITSFNDTYAEADAQIKIPEDSILNNESIGKFKAIDFFVKPVITGASYTYKSPGTMSPNSLTGKTVQPGGPKICEKLSKIIYDDISSNIGTETAAQYAYLVTFGGMFKQLADLEANIHAREDNLKKETANKYLEAAKAELGFVPYIGNVFHMLMAHVETFTHMMYELNNVIISNTSLRTPSALGLVGYTDTLPDKCKYVPAWPAIYKGSQDSGRYSVGETENDVLGWVGDISHSFEEERFVKALYSASYKTKAGGEGDKEFTKKIYHLPVAGIDIVDRTSPFSDFGILEDGNVISNLAGMLGMRVAQLFGVIDTDATQTNVAIDAGKMDGYNFFIHVADKGAIKSLVVDQAGGDKNLENILISAMTCSEDGDKYATVGEDGQKTHVFETAVNGVPPMMKSKRHPILVKGEDGKYDYVHYTTKSGYGVIPRDLKTSKWGDPYSTYYTQKPNGDNPYYVFTKTGFEGSIYRQPSDKILSDGIEDGTDTSEWKNDSRFTIYSDQNIVNAVFDKYNELKEGKIKVVSETYEENFNGVLERYWKIDDYKDDYEAIKSFYNSKSQLAVNYTSSNLSSGLWNKGLSAIPSLTCSEVYTGLNANQISFDKSDGKFKSGENVYEENSLFVPDLIFVTYGKDNYLTRNSLFACDTYLRNREDPYAQAYLFLMCLPLQSYKKYNFDAKIRAVTYGSLLKTGANYWRHQYMETNNVDPIKYDTSKYQGPSSNKGFTFINKTFTETSGGICAKGINNYPVVISDELEPDVVKALINEFEAFVKSGTWRTIRQLTDTGLTPETLKEVVARINTYHEQVFSLATDEESKTTAKQTYMSGCANLFKGIKNFGTSFKHADASKEGLYFCLTDTGELKDAINSLMFRKSVITCPSRHKNTEKETSNYSDIRVGETMLSNYLSGFAETLKKVVNGEVAKQESKPEDAAMTDENGVRYERDIMISMYKYLKNIWDKWLIQEARDTYMVENYFLNNFKFIDSAYRSIYNRMMINCQVLLDRYNQVKDREDVTLFKFIGDIVSDHHCMFLALPDFLTFSEAGKDDFETAKNKMSDLFTPVPYNKMSPPRQQNFFIIIYVPNLATTPSGELNAYHDETLNIWSQNGVDGNLPQLFIKSNWLNGDDAYKVNPPPGEDIENRYGYHVPAFAVAFGRQNNHLFKNVKLNMESPVVTSAVINTLSHISMRGSGNNHAIAFVGQDIYPVFSNYSFQAEVDMMGDAQIHPLMYFQLMNVPMWRGTYMIFNVKHNMTPGNMTTTFTGMKLGNYAVDYSSVWFTKKINFKKENTNGKNPCDNGNDNDPNTNSNPNAGNGITDYTQIKNPKMRQVLGLNGEDGGKGISYYYTNGGKKRSRGWYKLAENDYYGQCTCGPQTWYKRAGINLTFWSPKKYWTATHVDVAKNFEKHGFQLVHHANLSEAMKWSTSMFNIGDICTMHVGGLKVSDSHPDGNSGHAEMWDGKNWRSDAIQTRHGPGGLSCYGGGRGRDGDYSVCIWRHPEFQESGVTTTSASTSSTGSGSTTGGDDKGKKGKYCIHITKDVDASYRSTYTPYLLRVIDKTTNKTVLYSAVCVGQNKGQKTKKGDLKTPEGDTKIVSIEKKNSSHKFSKELCNGETITDSYGGWFLRLEKFWKGTGDGIGIHGIGSNRICANIYGDTSIGTGTGRGSEGCVRIYNDKLKELVEKYAYVGMPVKIFPDGFKGK